MIPSIAEYFGAESSWATLHEATVSFEEMGERSITSQIRIDGGHVPDFSGWYVVFKGEKFVLNSIVPQAEKSNGTINSLASLTFVSYPIFEMQRYFFPEMAQVGAGAYIAGKYEAPLSLNITDFVTAFNRVLNYYFDGSIVMTVAPGATLPADVRVMDINYSYIWDVLKKIYDVYGVSWHMEHNAQTDVYTIVVGGEPVGINHVFEYGYDGGLKRIERQAEDLEIYNELLGRGGEKNLPYRYFKLQDPNNTGWEADPDAIPELRNVPFDRLMDHNFRWYVRGWMHNPNRDTSGDEDWDPGHVFPTYSIDSSSPYYWAYQKGLTDTEFDPVEYVKDDNSIAVYGIRHGKLDDNDKIYPTIQGLEVSPFGRIDESVAIGPITDGDDGEEVVNGPFELYDIDLHNVSDNGLGIKIVGEETFMVNEGFVAALTYMWNMQPAAMKPATVLDTENSDIQAERISDGQTFPLYAIPAGGPYRLTGVAYLNGPYEEPAAALLSVNRIEYVETYPSSDDGYTFNVWVKNIWDTRQDQDESDVEYMKRVWEPILGDKLGNEAKLVFSSGWMSTSQDYEFTIVRWPQVDRTKSLNGVPSEWMLTLKKSDAEYDATGLYIPNASGVKPVAGDTFFLTGIDMPHIYVEGAEKKLTGTKIDALAEKAWANPTWSIELDKVRINTLEGQEAATLASLLDVGKAMQIRDARLTNSQTLTFGVRSITYTWNEPTDENPYLYPDVQVTLSEKALSKTGSIEKVTTEVRYIVAKDFVSTEQAQNMIYRAARQSPAPAGVDLDAVWESLMNNTDRPNTQINIAHLPELFIGTTLVQGSSAAQALTGITTLNASGLATIAGGIKLTTTKKIWFGDVYYIELDSNGIHTNAGFYSDSFVTAGGVGSGGGGGGGADLARVWESLTNNTDYPNVKINIAHIPDITTAKITDLETWIDAKGFALESDIIDHARQLLDADDLSYVDPESGTAVIIDDPGATGTVLWGAESASQVNLSVNGVTKTLLKLTALDGINSSIGVLLGYFSGGSAYNALALGGNAPSYFATAAGLSDLTDRVEALEEASFDADAMWELLAAGTNEQINVSHIPNLSISKVTGLQSALDGKQSVISDLSTIRSNAGHGETAYGWGDHASAGYFLASNFTQSNIKTTLDISDWALASTKPTYTKSEIGLGNVTNDAQVKRTEMGAASGVATLGTDGKVPSSQLPSYVDDVLEYASLSAFPTTGESGKIYVALDTNKTYRWSGSAYVEISPSIVIGTTTGTALDGKIGTDHINDRSNPHQVTKAQVGLDYVDNLAASGYFTSLTNDSGLLSITIGGTTKTLFVQNAQNASTLESHAASYFATASGLTALAGRVSTLEGRTNWDDYFGVDETTGAIYVKKIDENTPRDFYSYGAITAGGVGSGGGGGGSVDLDRVWKSLTNNTDKPNVKINIAHIPDITTAKVTDIETWISAKGYITAASLITAARDLTDANDLFFKASNDEGEEVIIDDPGTTGTVLWGAESANQVALSVNGTSKTLLKAAAIEGLTSSVGILLGYFSGGSARNALALEGHGSSYFATASALADLADIVEHLDTGVTSVVGQSGDVTVTQIASALTGAGYKLTDTIYTLPTATSGTLGGIKVGYSASGKNYAIAVDGSGNAYVNVPWTDTTYSEATTSAAGLMSAADKTKLNGVATGATNVTESTVSGWGFTKNTGTVTSVKVGNTSYNPTGGVVSLPAYPTVPTAVSAFTNDAGYLTSVAFADLTSHPTTLGEYGITDAKIANGTITLGSNTITPVVTETDPTVPAWAKASSLAFASLPSLYIGTTAVQNTSDTQNLTGIGSITASGALTLSTTKKIYFGDTDHYLELDSNGFHFSHGVYSDSFITAGGVGSGGGGGSIDLDRVWESLTNNTDKPNVKINVAHIPDITTAKITDLASYNSFLNYYLKSEVYTKTEVGNLIAAIDQFHYEIYPSTSSVTDPQGNVLYLIGPTGSGSDKYEEYVYANNAWTKIGDTSIDLTPYLLASVAASTYQPLDADLTAIAGLTGTSGLLKKTAANTWTLDTNTYLTSVAFADLTSHPTTISGYGITDAKIDNGVITLGQTTITPLTAHQTIYGLTLKNSEDTTVLTYNPATGSGSLKLTKALVGLDDVDNLAASGYFTLLENSSNQISITIGETNKKLTVAYASNAGTLENHAASYFATASGLSTLTGRVNDLYGRTNWDNYFGIDETTGAIYVKKIDENTPRNFYSYGAVTAGGVGTGGGGGGGVDIDRVWESLTNNTDKPNVKINIAHIPDITTSKVTDIESWIAAKGYVTSSGITSVSKGTAVSGGAVSTSGGAVTIQFPTIPTTLPASDVYAWAKNETLQASDVPSLTVSKISDIETWISGKNYLTGNQSITLSGDVSGSGATSIAVTIGDGKVTNAKLANSSIMIAGTSVSLGGAITAANLRSLLSINNVENTALSTWAGSTNITTLGTIATGVWNGTAIAANKLAIDFSWTLIGDSATYDSEDFIHVNS